MTKHHFIVASAKWLLGTVATNALVSGAAVAQTAPPAPPATEGVDSANQGIADIVVTASKRSERVQSVPITITAISGADLTSRAIIDPKSLTKAVPGLNVATTGGYNGKLNFTLRGVGLNTYSGAQEPAIAVYQDEVYVADGNAAQFTLFDIERVEVLRGPQGTLFGRSASGGLVNFISRNPGTRADGYLTLGVGSYGQRIAEAAQDVPLDSSGENALRFAFKYNGSNGFLHNIAGGKNLEGGDLYEGRVGIRLQPTPQVRIMFKGEYGKFDSDHSVGFKHINAYTDASGASQILGPTQNVYGTPGGDLFGNTYKYNDYYSVNIDSPGRANNRRTFLNNRIDWDLSGPILTAVSGYVRFSSNYLEDSDATPIPFVIYRATTATKEFTQELRLSSNPSSPIKWTIGGFYFNYKVHFNVVNEFPIGVPPLGINVPLSNESIADLKRHSFAGYGQFEVPLGDKLTFVAGGRIERESADFSYHQIFTPLALTSAVFGAAPVNFSPVINGDLAQIRKTFYSGGATLNYEPTNHVLLYTSLKRGIKPGSFSTPLSGIAADRMKFKEEKLDALEGGVKSDWLNGTLRLNASVFHYWYNNYQAVQYKGSGTSTGNATARLSGFDGEIIWAPTRAVEVGVNGGYVHSVARDIPLVGSSGVTYHDRTLPNAPKESLNAYLQYSLDALGGKLAFRADEIYRSKTYFEIQNNPALVQAGYHTEDLSVNYTTGNWSLSANVENVLNRKYIAYVQDNSSIGFVLVTPAKPRWFTFQITRKW